MKLVDTHAHLDLANCDFRSGDRIRSSSDRDLSGILKRAKENGVEKIVTISSNLEECEQAVKIAEKNEGVWASCGVHPDEAGGMKNEDWERLRGFLGHEKCVAVGECGFDFGPHGEKASAEIQEGVFRKQCELGREFSLPVIVHSREADELVLKVMGDFKDVKMVVHCFQSGMELEKAVLENENWMMSFTGLVTFGKSVAGILESVKRVPLEKMMVETDAPFLAPEPHRGEINEPGFVKFVAEKIAEVKGVEVEKVAEITTGNAERFFGI